MRKEIVLPPHLYDRIRASAGEHGGIGAGNCFSAEGFPLCAHGHAWISEDRYAAHWDVSEPELKPFLTWNENDDAVDPVINYRDGARISFEKWCELLNVRRGAEVPATECELVSVA